ncbi:hypothetical protein CLF_112953 [Clonorchis sinensis]|uniref:CRIM domain-containing protein n=1 Tax=Clonorchis sinensis TaxID=79923 RepID=H2KVR7_CLOSI|nr:hypothetical protein CLF_112953 [Clonorchis sinensis]
MHIAYYCDHREIREGDSYVLRVVSRMTTYVANQVLRHIGTRTPNLMYHQTDRFKINYHTTVVAAETSLAHCADIQVCLPDPLEHLLSSSCSSADAVGEHHTKSDSSQSSKSRTLTAAEIDHYFPVKPTPTLPEAQSSFKPRKSSLTLALEQAKADGRLLRNNLFSDYAVHDGRFIGPGPHPTVGDSGSRLFTVWFWRVSGFPQTSIRVQPNPGTTVRQFVGLSFWQYFNELPQADQEAIPLKDLERFDKNFVDRISVYMFETPADMDESCFPPFEPSDPIHKYEFDALAFVEQVVPAEVPLVFVTM